MVGKELGEPKEEIRPCSNFMSPWQVRASDQLLLKCCDRGDDGPKCFLGGKGLALISRSQDGQSNRALEMQCVGTYCMGLETEAS